MRDTNALRAVLNACIAQAPGVPGAVAMLTDRDKTIFEASAGESRHGSGAAMNTDNVFAIFSATKQVTGTAVLQCVEDQSLDLDAPAKIYVPEIAELQVLDGFDSNGPRLRPPKRDITTRMLMMHTAGFGYDFFNEHYNRLVENHGQEMTISGLKKAIMTPLLFDPGDRWEYGTSTDWCGQIVERIHGKRLGDVFRERIFEPLEIQEMGFDLTADMERRLAAMHSRNADGSLTVLDDFRMPVDPEVQMGGGALYSTIADYMKFIRMWLNEGAGPKGRVLRPETVRAALRNGLEPHQQVRRMPGVKPALANDAEFFPGLAKSWGYTFMINDDDAPTGRPAGSIAWSGLANLYYWIDIRNGIGGFWASQILPYADPAALDAFLAFETAVYQQFAPHPPRLTVRDAATV